MPHTRTFQNVVFPSRDSSFGSLIRQLSEQESGRPADNLITNEDSFPRVAGELQKQAPKGGVYLGVGPDQNFTYLEKGQAELAFILDFRRRNLLLHLLHKALFMLSKDRESYLSRLTARLPDNLPNDPTADELVEAFAQAEFDRSRLAEVGKEVVALLRPLKVVDEEEWEELNRIQARLAGPGMNARFLAMPIYPTFGSLIRTKDREGKPAHFLAQELTYQAVRQAQAEDRIIPIVGDFAGRNSLPRLNDWLRGQGLLVSILYISDVEFFLLRAGTFHAYIEHLNRLPWADGALLIRSSTRELDHPERVEGDRCTTILRPVAPFLGAALGGKILTANDLFR